MRIPQSFLSEPLSDYEKRVKEYKKYKKHCKKIGVHPISWYKKKTNESGFVEFQAWHFIEMFGNYTGMGMKTIYETNILIKKSNLTPVK